MCIITQFEILTDARVPENQLVWVTKLRIRGEVNCWEKCLLLSCSSSRWIGGDDVVVGSWHCYGGSVMSALHLAKHMRVAVFE